MRAEKYESTAAEPAAATEPEFHVVGVGASAGGLAALQALLTSLPENSGIAWVIVTHLSPEHESHLPDLLQKCTAMQVRQVNSTMELERNHVYVIPPNANLDTIDTHLRLTELEERRNERAPIDHFLRTLATTHDGTAIGAILTGAGTDGTLGLRHIKECGGLTIAQAPEEAEFDSMPRSAIASGMVDLVLPLQRIGQEILSFCATRPQVPVPDGEDKIEPRDNAVVERLLSELRKRTQQDFTVYRRSTLLRRVRRRMQLHHVTTLASYLEVLTREAKEAEALVSDLLLTPSEFFGDLEAFAELAKRVIPDIFDRKASEQRERVRVWTIGCSSGEEAYSLAMLLVEESEKRSRPMTLQVFASDLSDRMLGLAREGIYPREIATSVSAERLERFFISQPGFYRVKREIQDMVLFTSHNLFKDPPFGHIDLIMCRTLLSDLQPEVRRGVLALFHYALEPEGMLLLGPHDEVDTPELFDRQPGPGRLFRRRRGAKHLPRLPDSMRPFGHAGAGDGRRAPHPQPTNAIVSLYCAAIEPYAPASVLINDMNDVVHFSSTAAKYLRIPGGEFTKDLTRLLRDPLRRRVVAGLRRVREGAQRWHSEPLSIATDHGAQRIILRLEHLIATELTLVVFDDCAAAPTDAEHPKEAANTIKALQAEIDQLRGRQEGPEARSRPHVDSQLEDAAEDLQVALAELASSREELQATNEELLALDDENRRRVHELTRISNDLQHLLISTGIATLFLDVQLNIVRFTPELGGLFGLRPADIGRPITDLARPIRYENFESDARGVLRTLEPVDREITTTDERWYLARILPYRTEAGQVDGIVLTLLDITERKHAEQALRESGRQKDEFLAMLAHELRNPLAPISSGVEVLKAAPGDRRLVERMAATMGRQTRQLVRLVDDLLEISRISSGKLHLRLGIVELEDVIEDAVSSAKPALESAGHALELEIAPERLAVEADAARLTQVLSNLLSNAVRYSPRSGLITVRAARENDMVVVAVKDQGVGISRESLGHVFDLFYQGRDTRARFGAGLGIGLTLAKTLVEMHGGSITAASAGENRGSEFTIRVPLARSVVTPDPLAAKESQQPRFGGDHRILIVDDNVDAAETLCTLMKSLGEHEVHTAASGAAALEAAPGLRPNIVLLDLMMPEMDGYEVARRMRSQPWGKHLRLVALSGWGHEEHRRRAREAGFDQHVTKPANLASLQAVLNGWQRPS